jgi:hypothetical protein
MAEAPPETKAWMVKAWRDLETARRYEPCYELTPL